MREVAQRIHTREGGIMYDSLEHILERIEYYRTQDDSISIDSAFLTVINELISIKTRLDMLETENEVENEMHS